MKRKRVLPLPASYAEGEDEEEDRNESTELVSNHSEELQDSIVLLAESGGSKPKVKTKSEADPPVETPQSPDCQVIEQESPHHHPVVSETVPTGSDVLVNHADNAHPSSPLTDGPCATTTLLDPSPSAIIVKDSGEETEPAVPEPTPTSAPDDVDMDVLPVTGTRQVDPIPAISVDAGDQETSAPAPTSPVPAPAEVVMSDPQLPADVTETVEEGLADSPARDSLATKVKCEVEETLNDVKRDDFFAGNETLSWPFKFWIWWLNLTALPSFCRTSGSGRSERPVNKGRAGSQDPLETQVGWQ